MVTILLANGFEVAEVLVTLDLLHRAGVEACLTGLHSGEVTSANGRRWARKPFWLTWRCSSWPAAWTTPSS